MTLIYIQQVVTKHKFLWGRLTASGIEDDVTGRPLKSSFAREIEWNFLLFGESSKSRLWTSVLVFIYFNNNAKKSGHFIRESKQTEIIERAEDRHQTFLASEIIIFYILQSNKEIMKKYYRE